MNTADKQRIEKLRAAALDPVIGYSEFYLYFFRRFAANEGCGTLEERYAEAYEYAFANGTPVIDDGELIVGKACTPLNGEQAAEWQQLRESCAEKVVPIFGQDSHMAIDYELLLNEGLEGIAARIDAKLAAETDENKVQFYRCSKAALGTIAAFADRYAALAKQQAAACADPVRKAELEQLAVICGNVPRRPAASFWEAVQSVHFLTLCVSIDPYRFFGCQQFQLGHPDRYLLKYYEKDIADGTLTRERAQLLLDCLAIQINNRVHHGLSSGYMVGGHLADGTPVANDLTSMGMQVVDDVRLVYPAVGLCVNKNTPDRFIQEACALLAKGYSHPAIFNDDVITEGLMSYGLPADEASEYIHSTCVEITPAASSNVWVASPYTNMIQLLLDCLAKKETFDSFDELYAAVLTELDAHILANFEKENGDRIKRTTGSIKPLLSCFVRDCIENGTDIEQGGARYNWIMPSFVGMANLVDALYAIKTLIFDKKELTFAELNAALAADYVGYEKLRLKILNGVPKYGNDVDEIDCYFDRIVTHIVEECRKYTPVLPNARLIPSVFCWVMHERFGSETGASPDGRCAGFPLGDGSGPCQGREANGPTASILSSTKWSHKELIGGVAVNMKFSKKAFTEESGQKMLGLVRTYLARGGFELQINVVDRDTLLRAQAEPENYRDLVVRIGGYSDYFVTRSPNMQAEVLLRTEHEL